MQPKFRKLAYKNVQCHQWAQRLIQTIVLQRLKHFSNVINIRQKRKKSMQCHAGIIQNVQHQLCSSAKLCICNHVCSILLIAAFSLVESNLVELIESICLDMTINYMNITLILNTFLLHYWRTLFFTMMFCSTKTCTVDPWITLA